MSGYREFLHLAYSVTPNCCSLRPAVRLQSDQETSIGDILSADPQYINTEHFFYLLYASMVKPFRFYQRDIAEKS